MNAADSSAKNSITIEAEFRANCWHVSHPQVVGYPTDGGEIENSCDLWMTEKEKLRFLFSSFHLKLSENKTTMRNEFD